MLTPVMKMVTRQMKAWLRKNSLIFQEPQMVHTWIFAISSLAISDEMWFLTADPVSLTICILVPESITNSLSSGSLAEALGRTHFAGANNVALSFALSL